MKKQSTVESAIKAEMDGVESGTHRFVDFDTKFEAMREKSPEERFASQTKLGLSRIQKSLEDLAEVQEKKAQRIRDEKSKTDYRQERLVESQKNGYPEGWEPTEEMKDNTRSIKIETKYKSKAPYASQEEDLYQALNNALKAIKKQKFDASLKIVEETIQKSLSNFPIEETEKKELPRSFWARIKLNIGDWLRQVGGKIRKWKKSPE